MDKNMLSEIISFQTNGIVSVVEFNTKKVNTIDYISGASAMAKNYIEVKEISQSGSVNNLVVENNSDKFVFLSDGDILSGAKQNRVLNTSVFLSPNSKKLIPVSCVESGRWHSVSSTFNSTDYSSPINLRAIKAKQVNKNLENEQGYYSDQNEVWNMVKSYCKDSAVDSATQNLSDVFEIKKSNIEAFNKPLQASERANGLSIFIKKELLSIEVFNRTDIYKEYFSKILKGVSAEAYYLKEEVEKLQETEARYKTNVFFDELGNRVYKEFPAAGTGTEKRYSSDDFSGFALEYEGHLIHLAMLSLVRKK